MDINEIIDWLSARQDIVIADKDKFFEEMRDALKTKEGFLEQVKAFGKHCNEEFIGEGRNNSILIIADSGDRCATSWHGSVAGLAKAYAQFAINDEDYVKLMEAVSRILMAHSLQSLKDLFGYDTD